MGLYNLENILGNNLYLDQYALYVKDNFKDSHTHNGNETRDGLCYVDTVNWVTILNNNSYLIDNNGDDCPSCYEECVGCFSEGPRYCQDCLHYKSGDTCRSVRNPKKKSNGPSFLKVFFA